MSSETIPVPSAEQAEAILCKRLRGQILELLVQVREEGIVLQGSAASYYGKQMAQHLAHELLKKTDLGQPDRSPVEAGIGPRMTRIVRIFADKEKPGMPFFFLIRANPHNPCHPRSIGVRPMINFQTIRAGYPTKLTEWASAHVGGSSFSTRC